MGNPEKEGCRPGRRGQTDSKDAESAHYPEPRHCMEPGRLAERGTSARTLAGRSAFILCTCFRQDRWKNQVSEMVDWPSPEGHSLSCCPRGRVCYAGEEIAEPQRQTWSESCRCPTP